MKIQKGSEFGVISITIAISTVLILFFDFSIYIGEIFKEYTSLLEAIVTICIATAGIAIGIGIASIIKKEENKIFATIGISISSVLVFLSFLATFYR